MLEVVKSSNIEKLGDYLKTRIKENKDFFNSPFVVFKNQNMEKWFKTYWLKTEKDVLMNVMFGNILDLITKNNHEFSLASTNDLMLSITKLVTSGKFNNERCSNYLFGEDGKYDATKVRDFSSELAKYFSSALLEKVQLDDWHLDLYNLVCEDLEKKNLYTINNYIEKEGHKKLGYKVYIVNEMATTLILGGILPQTVGKVNFQII